MNSATHCGSISMPLGSVAPLVLFLCLPSFFPPFDLKIQTETPHTANTTVKPSIKNTDRILSQSLPTCQGYPLQIPFRETTQMPHRYTKHTHAPFLSVMCRLFRFVVKYSQYHIYFQGTWVMRWLAEMRQMEKAAHAVVERRQKVNASSNSSFFLHSSR